MKVGRVQTFLAAAAPAKNLLFVKVETDDGLHGWGECYTILDRDLSTAAHVNAMARYLVGRSPFNIKHFCHVMYQDFVAQRGGMDFYCALSGIEQALWDIVGKALGQPVYNLLGGACRSRIKVYANGWAGIGSEPDVTAANAKEMVERGFTALKWDPFPSPRRAFPSKQDEQFALEGMRNLRDAVGPNVDLMIEGHRRLAPMHAIKFARAVEELDIYWYEEPTTTENLDNLAMVRGATTIPIVGGEDLYTKTDFREVFEKGAVDIINPDVMLCGGILALKELAAMAEPYDVAVSPHGYGVCVGLASTVQASAVMTNYLTTDYYAPLEPIAHAILQNPIQVVDSYIPLPTAPGLGVDVDEAAFKEFPYQEMPARRIRSYEEEGP